MLGWVMFDFLPANYLVTLWLHNVMLAAMCVVTGWMVVRFGVKTNYTRKINHFALMVIPFGLGAVLPYKATPLTISVTLFVFVATTLVFLVPVRRRFAIVEMAFASVDRPEDRPHTLSWIVSQAIASYAVLVAIFLILSDWEHAELIAIVLIVTGVGDGLAEPVGVRFGKHRYGVPSLAKGRRYDRSVEGSACVFVVALITIYFVGGHVTPPQWWGLIVAIPTVMTVAEAVSPHSWDAPILYASGGATIVAVLACL